MKKLIITKMPFNNSEIKVAATCDDLKVTKIDIHTDKQYQLGDIFVGKVKNVLKNIQAAFVEITNGIVCYLPLSDLESPIFLNKNSEKKPIVAGDELLVQIVKDCSKSKAAVVSSNLSFTGKYFVISSSNKCIGISQKINKKKAEELKTFVHSELSNFDNFDFGIIIRTNAKEASQAQMSAELKILKKMAEKVIYNGIHRTCYSKIYETLPEYIVAIKNCYMENLDEILTDDIILYEEIKEYLQEKQPEDLDKLCLYNDNLLPLYNLYNLHNQIEAATKKRVWLKSGGYLIIEQTEAMVVVDVNTGKFDGKRKDKEENFLKTNIEAAKELANQLILRNLSGMILIDFISMENKEYKKKLIEVLTAEIKKDSVKTDFIDITKLGIVELTRKKQKKSLAEIIKSV